MLIQALIGAQESSSPFSRAGCAVPASDQKQHQATGKACAGGLCLRPAGHLLERLKAALIKSLFSSAVHSRQRRKEATRGAERWMWLLAGGPPFGDKPHLLQPLACVLKSLQSCPTLCDPMGWSPPGSSVHGILQARTLQ